MNHIIDWEKGLVGTVRERAVDNIMYRVGHTDRLKIDLGIRGFF